jgi:hypothetical protein
LINILLILIHRKIKGLTIKTDTTPANIVTKIVTSSKEKQIVAICIPNSIFQGMMIRPIANSENRIRQKLRTNLNSLTTRKQMNKDKRITIRYAIINVLFPHRGLKM